MYVHAATGGLIIISKFQVTSSFTLAWTGQQTCKNALGGEITYCDPVT